MSAMADSGPAGTDPAPTGVPGRVVDQRIQEQMRGPQQRRVAGPIIERVGEMVAVLGALVGLVCLVLLFVGGVGSVLFAVIGLGASIQTIMFGLLLKAIGDGLFLLNEQVRLLHQLTHGGT